MQTQTLVQSDTARFRDYPVLGKTIKIGIRPTIDGRRKGVRESLEAQTMTMARAAAKLLTENLRYGNGMAVEVVIADTCIGGVAEAAACQAKFEREGVGLSLTVTPCWCYGSETMDMTPFIPKAIWGFNGTERPGAVYLAAALANHNLKGLPAFSIYGREVQAANDMNIPPDVKEKLLDFAQAGLAVATMRGKSYLSLGGVSMGIGGSIVNQDFFEDYLNMRVEAVDMSELVRRLEEGIYDPEEYKRALAWTYENCSEGKDWNSPKNMHSTARKKYEWETVVKMTMMARDLMTGNPRLEKLGFGEEALGHNAIVGGFQGQRQWTDHFPNGDFMEAILTSSFDWNGIRPPMAFATENDCLNGTCMVLGQLLTNTAQIFADVRTYWSPDSIKKATGVKLKGMGGNGLLHLINSGAATLDGTGKQRRNGKPAMKPFWEISQAEVDACLRATSWPAAIDEYFRGGGFSSCYLSEGGMPMTMSRISMVKGLGPVMQIAEGWLVDLPPKVHKILNERTNPSWPTTWFAPRLTGEGAFRDVYTVMNNWSANHGSISYGHIGRRMIEVASMLRIPIAMHNVPEEQIFRPSTWGLFGTKDLESADFRACKNFGPLYSSLRR